MTNHKTNNLIPVIILSFWLIISLASSTKAQSGAEGCCTMTCPGIAPHSTTEFEINCPKEINGCTGVFDPNKIASVPNGLKCVGKDATIITPVEPSNPITFTPQISIPKSDFISGKGVEIPANAKILVNYIIAIFKYLIAISGIIAAIVLMFGGVRWLTAGGNQIIISDSKKYIFSSLTGLVLTLGSFTLLSIINTNLVNLSVPDIKYIKYEALGENLSDEEYAKNIKDMKPMYQGDKPTGDVTYNSNHKPNTKTIGSADIEQKIAEKNLNENYILNKYKENFYSLLSINEVQASGTFNPPSGIPLLHQAGTEVWNKDYSRECDQDCNEPSDKSNVLCKDKEPFQYNGKNKYFSTVASSGCGIMSLQMVLAAYGKVSKSANDTMTIVKFMETNNSWRVCPGGGTSKEGMSAYAASLGMEAEIIDASYAKKLLEAGYPVMAGLSASSGCTGGGHWVVLRGLDNSKYTVNNPETSHTNCQNTLPNGDKGITKFLFVHPPGSPNVDNSTSCINKWSWGCSYNSQNCCDGKCIFGDDACTITSKNIKSNKCYKCGDCIATWHWGCRKNSDCCSGQCHTSGSNKYQCYE